MFIASPGVRDEKQDAKKKNLPGVGRLPFVLPYGSGVPTLLHNRLARIALLQLATRHR